MTSAVPPTGAGPLAKREARLAWGLLFPTIFSVSLVVILPLLAIFWVSFKPIGLEDLRLAAPHAEGVRPSLHAAHEEAPQQEEQPEGDDPVEQEVREPLRL